MRSSTPPWRLGLLAAFALLGFSPAQAGIVAVSGAALQMAAPASVVPNAGFESFTDAAVFNEQQNVTLSQALQLDATASGPYTTLADLTPGSVAAGTLVSSHYLHADPVGSGQVIYWYIGSVTFDADILGIAALNQQLLDSDDLGAAGTVYPTAATVNGLDFNEGTDSFTISADRRTLNFRVAAYAGSDAMRIITAGRELPEPGGLALATAAFGALVLTRRRATTG